MSYNLFLLERGYILITKHQRKISPFYTYSVYVDTLDYLADTVISDICLDLEVLDETKVELPNGNEYILLYVRYKQSDEERFRKFLSILKYNMALLNGSTYLRDCKRIMEDLNKNEVFGGNWC